MGFDGTNALITERAAMALKTKINPINLTIRGEAYENRLLKYCERGYSIRVPELGELGEMRGQ